jgi:hypothetical protein
MDEIDLERPRASVSVEFDTKHFEPGDEVIATVRKGTAERDV